MRTVDATFLDTVVCLVVMCEFVAHRLEGIQPTFNHVPKGPTFLYTCSLGENESVG